MRLNPDCIRDILLGVEENQSIDSRGKLIELSYDDVVSFPNLSKYQSNIVYFHINLLFEQGLLIKGKQYICDSSPRISSLSEKGYTLVDSIRSNSKWATIKNHFIKFGTISLPVLITFALNHTIPK